MARLPPLNWLRAFEASARALSFTAAAQELSMTQSAVSQQIKGLENALGRALFCRRVRGLELTDEGRGDLPAVQAAFALLREVPALFMVIERFAGNDMVPVCQRLQDQGRALPEGLGYLGSRVEAGFARCFQLMECDDLRPHPGPACCSSWRARWRRAARRVGQAPGLHAAGRRFRAGAAEPAQAVRTSRHAPPVSCESLQRQPCAPRGRRHRAVSTRPRRSFVACQRARCCT